MTEPDPNPQGVATAMANGSGPTDGSGIEAVSMDKPGEQKKYVEELNVMKENNVMEEMKNLEGDRAVEDTEDVEEKNGADGDAKENKSEEEMKEGTEKNGAEGRNGMEEINEGEAINSGKDINDEKDTEKVEEISAMEENRGVEKVKDQEEEHIIDEVIELGETKGPAVKKDSNGKMDMEKKLEETEVGKGEKRINDAEMAEADDVKEEEKMDTDGGVGDDGVTLGEKDAILEKLDSGSAKEEADGNKKVEVSKKKRSRSGRKAGEKLEEKDKKEGEKKVGEAKEKNDAMKKVKEQLSSPASLFIERPVRERKTVERLVEVIEKEPNKGVVIEKGRGTPLKDISKVSYKLAKKKPGDLKLLHQTLFGRKGKAVDFKNHILQFSGFAWHESDDQQRAKVKERLDKCVKDSLIDLCDLLDISVSKANARKEDLISKLLDFMVAPHATTDVLLAEQQSPKSRKRKMVARGSASKGTEDAVVKQSRKKRVKIEHVQSSKEKNVTDTEDDDDHEEDADNKREGPSEDEELGHSDSEKEKEYKEANEKDEDKDDKDDEDSGKGKQSMKKSSKEQNSLKKEKAKTESSSKKTPSVTTAKSPEKTPSSTHSESAVKSVVGDKVFVRKKKKNVDPPKKKSISKPDVKEKSSGKRSTGDKSKSEAAEQSNPSKEELRETTCEILKKVDFNTATFTDILKKLATHYKVDLTPRKAAIKLMVQEELTRLADEVAESEEEGRDSEKEEHPVPRGKKVEA